MTYNACASTSCTRQAFVHGKAIPTDACRARRGRTLAPPDARRTLVGGCTSPLALAVFYCTTFSTIALFLDIAVRAPWNTQPPIPVAARICLHEDLIYAYLGVRSPRPFRLHHEALDFMARK